MNSEGNCVENGSGKLSPNGMCYLEDGDGDEIGCYKRVKLCSEIDANNCDSHSPEVKLCFNLYDHYCQEIKVDSQCSINEKNECTGDKCQFDEDKDKCYYQEESNSSILRMKQFILLMLFFMF